MPPPRPANQPANYTAHVPRIAITAGWPLRGCCALQHVRDTGRVELRVGRGTARKSSPQAPPALHVHRRYAPRPPRRPPPSASRPQVPAPASTSSSSRGEKAESSSVGTFVYAAPGPRTLTFFLTQQPQQSRNTGLRQPMRTISCATLTRVEQDNPERPECPKIALVLCFWLFRGSIQLFGFVRTRRCHTHRSRWQPPASTVRSQ